MKIVIDIPEKYLNSNIIDVTVFTVANNTITDVNVEDECAEFQVLPKGHGRLIDASVLKDKVASWLKPEKPDETEMISLDNALVSTIMEIEEVETVIGADNSEVN